MNIIMKMKVIFFKKRKELIYYGEGFEEVKTGLSLKKSNASEETACQNKES